MLRIYFKEDILSTEDQQRIITDVEKAFKEVKVTGTEKEREMLKLIEQAEYNDGNSFIDRFGFKLYNSELSTGCKAALCVLGYPNNIIDLKECGLNARDVIISICDIGNIFISDNGITFCDYAGRIDARVGDYIFHDVNRLNRYIQNERYIEHYHYMGDVEHV